MPHGVDEAAHHVERGAAAADHERGRVERPHGARQALLGKGHGEKKDAEAAAAESELERLHVQRLEVKPSTRVEEQYAL